MCLLLPLICCFKFIKITEARRIFAMGLPPQLVDAPNVTPASRTVREGSADGPPGNVQIFIWMDVGPTCHSSLPPHFAQSRAVLERSRCRRPLPSISLLRPPNLDSLREHLPQHLLHLLQPPAGFFSARIAPTAAGHHWSPLEACSTVDPLLQSSSARTDRRACCRLLCGV